MSERNRGTRRVGGGAAALVVRCSAVAMALLAPALAGTAWADCPYDPFVDCGDGSCCPGGDTCCGGVAGNCCKPGAVCSNGACVDSGSTGGGTYSSECPNGTQHCSGGKICCGDNQCYEPGSICCGGSGTGNKPHGCGADQTCCGDSCVDPGFICCSEQPSQGCVAETQVCCNGQCCDKNPASSSADSSSSGCQTVLSAPGESGWLPVLLSAVLITGALAWLSIRRRHQARP